MFEDYEDDYISREDYNRELFADCDRGDIINCKGT